MEKCYMCDRQATSREHVPPKCLFPEGKDMDGENHRSNLITVPSCDLHNTAKSRDDEFLMVSLAGIIGNNSIGYRHKFGKVNKAIRRSANKLLLATFKGKQRFYVVEVGPNKFVDVIWGTPDSERLKVCFEHIVHGLHFHHFGHTFKGRIKLHFAYLWSDNKNATSFRDLIKAKLDVELAGRDKFGENQGVFYYQITDRDQFDLYMFRLCFYGGINVHAAMIPEHADVQKDLAWMLVEGGIKTIFNVGDKKFEFN
ncbi:hypothetical protein [Dyella sp. C9]|uniref:hypothetical protein n=1 Tax=Dyella sp. C9 TaxID=2202154 RepID=UPI000DEFB6F4|nr:hypothetical protein [Dyella sp. C9]